MPYYMRPANERLAVLKTCEELGCKVNRYVPEGIEVIIKIGTLDYLMQALEKLGLRGVRLDWIRSKADFSDEFKIGGCIVIASFVES